MFIVKGRQLIYSIDFTKENYSWVTFPTLKSFPIWKNKHMSPMLLKVFWEIYLWVPDYEILGSFLIVVCNSSSDSAISHCMLDTRMRMYVYKICWYINHLRSLVFVISRRCSLGNLRFTQFNTTIYWNATWLLLSFFMCLHNQLSSVHSIVTYQKVQMFEMGDSSKRQKMNACSFRKKLSWFLS